MQERVLPRLSDLAEIALLPEEMFADLMGELGIEVPAGPAFAFHEIQRAGEVEMERRRRRRGRRGRREQPWEIRFPRLPFLPRGEVLPALQRFDDRILARGDREDRIPIRRAEYDLI